MYQHFKCVCMHSNVSLIVISNTGTCVFKLYLIRWTVSINRLELYQSTYIVKYAYIFDVSVRKTEKRWRESKIYKHFFCELSFVKYWLCLINRPYTHRSVCYLSIVNARIMIRLPGHSKWITVYMNEIVLFVSPH